MRSVDQNTFFKLKSHNKAVKPCSVLSSSRGGLISGGGGGGGGASDRMYFFVSR